MGVGGSQLSAFGRKGKLERIQMKLCNRGQQEACEFQVSDQPLLLHFSNPSIVRDARQDRLRYGLLYKTSDSLHSWLALITPSSISGQFNAVWNFRANANRPASNSLIRERLEICECFLGTSKIMLKVSSVKSSIELSGTGTTERAACQVMLLEPGLACGVIVGVLLNRVTPLLVIQHVSKYCTCASCIQ